MPTRIAVVLQTPRDAQSGVLNGYLALQVHLRAAGIALDVLTPDDLASRGLGRWTPLLYPGRVRRWAAREARTYELVVFHSYAGWRAAPALAAAGVPYVVAFHGLEPLYHEQLRLGGPGIPRPTLRYRLLQETLMPRFLQRSCRSAAAVFCHNSEERGWLQTRGWISGDRIRVVPHGVPDAFFAPDRSSVRRLLFAGQWLPMKGIGCLVPAAETLLRADPGLTLVCAGTLVGAETVSGCFDPAVRGRVQVVPRADRELMAHLYREADVFVFPSLYEGFGRALIEAMASRLPIVTTRVGVAIDALRDGESALFVPRRDPAALVAAVERLQRNAGLRLSLAEAAHRAAGRYRESDRTRDLALALCEAAGLSYPCRTAS